MRTFLKNRIVPLLPLFLKRTIVTLHESVARAICLRKEKKEYSFTVQKKAPHSRKRILVYHLYGSAFGGTEKNLQVMANGLVDEYDVYFMCSDPKTANSRLAFLDKRITIILFEFSSVESSYPYFIHGMNPHIKNIVNKYEIDMVLVSEIGHSVYPVITMLNVPIIMINNFGSPTVQKNIKHVNYVSTTVRDKALFWIGKQTYSVLNTPTTQPMPKSDVEDLRTHFAFKEIDFIFGRTGRNSDAIFDPIGIRAFKKVVGKHPEAHMLVMAAPPALEKIVREENIPNVTFLPPTMKEEDIWAFHHALDTLTHYRYDGETLGLNIAESMRVGNPIISHVSHIWNAHVAYLTPEFSRVAEIDNVDQYASYMEEFIELKKTNPKSWDTMRRESKEAGDRLFSKEKYVARFKEAIKAVLS